MVAKIYCDIFSMQCSWNFSKEPRFSSITAHWLLNSSWFHWPGGKKSFLYWSCDSSVSPQRLFFFPLLGVLQVKEMLQYLILFTAVHQHTLKTHSQYSSRAVVPNIRVTDRYQSMVIQQRAAQKRKLTQITLFDLPETDVLF